MHGAGFTGSGERYLKSVVASGSHTRRPRAHSHVEHRDRPRAPIPSFRRSSADALGIDYDFIELAQPDTASCSQQRPHRRVADLHDRRQTRRIGRAGHETDAHRRWPLSNPPTSPAPAATYFHEKLGKLRDCCGIPGTSRRLLGRRQVSGRSLRNLCLGRSTSPK